jgi:hypothetical protein
MKRLSVVMITSCLITAACDDDPARSTKIVSRPPVASRAPDAHPASTAAAPSEAPSTASAPVAPAAAPPAASRTPRPAAPAVKPASVAASRPAEWRPFGCPPPAEGADGPSAFAVTGPCAFEHKGAVSCETLPDDLLLTMTRKGARGTTLMVYINVERYHGPGSYPDGQMFVGLQDKKNIYRWSSDAVNITVGDGGEQVVLPPTKLEAEPLLVNCSGPMNNYQCEGRGEADAFERTIAQVSGTLRCDGPPKAN